MPRIGQIETDTGSPLDILTLGDGVAQPTNVQSVASLPLGWNGVTWDRLRSNTKGVAFASAVRAATVYSADIELYNARGVIVVISITVVPGGDTVQIRPQYKAETPGSYADIDAGTAKATTGLDALSVYPGATAGYPNRISATISPTFRISVIHSGAGNFTYTVDYYLMI